MPQRQRTLLVVIDAQRAFVDREGSVARAYGFEDVQPGIATLGRLCGIIAEHRAFGPTIFVRSEYEPGQFTDGQLDHAMAYVCVPGMNIDCEWAAGVDVAPHDVVVTKHHADAATSDAFRVAIERAVANGTKRIVIAGFQLTTCVVASAVSTLDMVRGRGVRVTVIEALTGIRASSRVPGPSGVSRVETTRGLLAAAGIEVLADETGDY